MKALHTSKVTPRGFTLVELMATVVIIGLLVTMLIPFVSDYTSRTKSTVSTHNLEILNKALDFYKTIGGVRFANSLSGTNNTAKVNAIIAQLKNGITINGQKTALLDKSIDLSSVNLYGIGQGNLFFFSATPINIPTVTVNASPNTGPAPLSSTITWSTTDAISASLSVDSVTVAHGTAGSYNATGLTPGTHTAIVAATGAAGSASGSTSINVNLTAQTVAISPTSQTIYAGDSVSFAASGGNTSYTWGGTSGASGSGATKNVTFASAGTYTVTVQANASGSYAASNTASATITVNPLVTQTVAISPTSQTIYAGDSVSFTASGGSTTYTWGGSGGASGSGSTKSVTFASAGTYTVTVLANAAPGYAASNTASATITVNPVVTQTVDINPTPQTIYAGDSVSFTASGGSTTYTWGGSASGSGSTKSVTFASAGTYTVTVLANAAPGYAASNTASATITVNPIVAQTVAISPSSQTINTGDSITFTASGGSTTYTWGGAASGSGSSQSVTFPTAGTYNVTVQANAATGYAASNVASASITVNAIVAQSAVNVTPAAYSVIAGDSLTFTASGGNGTGAYTWGGTAGATGTGSSQTITFPSVGTYTVTTYRAASTGYTASNTATATITVGNVWYVSTLAGSGTAGFADATGTAAQFNNPRGITIDSNNNIYVVDAFNYRIRKITPAGIVTTFVGNGGSSNTDGTGTSAQIAQAFNIGIDGNNNIFLADTMSCIIRKITSAAVVTTLAGSGDASYADGTGTAAIFDTPRGIAANANGNIYVADTDNNRIRVITQAGVVTTLAGSVAGTADGTGSAAQFNHPYGLTADNNNYVYVADTNTNRIRKVSPAGVVTTLAGGASAGATDGTGTAALFYQPHSITVDTYGNLYVADYYNHKIRKVTPAGVVTTVAGTGTAGYADGVGSSAQFYYPEGIAVDKNGNLYVGDSSNHRVRKISPHVPTTQTVGISPSSQTVNAGDSVTFTASGGNVSYTWGGSSGASGTGTTKSITFATAGTYTVTVQDPGDASYSASNTASATITVNPIAQTSVSITPTSQSINAGDSLTFTASGGSGTGAYTWGGTSGATGTGSSQTITFPSAGTYTITAYRAADATYLASSTTSVTITVVTPVAQTVALSASSTTIYAGGAVTFTASGGSTSYNWSGSTALSGTGATQNILFNNSGSYTISVQAPAGAGYTASNTASVTITVNPCARFVAINTAASQTGYLYSLDGKTWTAGTLPKAAMWHSVVFAKGKFVAAGETAIAYSSDGITWTSASSSKRMTALAYGSSTFLALNGGSAMYSSSDGINWPSIGTTFFGVDPYQMGYVNGCFVTKRDGYTSGSIFYSNDGGANWSTVATNLLNSWTGLAGNHNDFLIAASGWSGEYTFDGANWSTVTLGAAGSTNIGGKGCYDGKQVVFVNAYGSAGGVVTVSKSGSTVTPTVIGNNLSNASSLKDIAYSGGMYVAVGNTSTAYTYDLTNWTYGTLPATVNYIAARGAPDVDPVPAGASTDQTITLTPGTHSISVGETVTFYASGSATGYNWSGTAGASGTGSTKSITFGSTGTYTVIVQAPAATGYAASNTITATVSVGNWTVSTLAGTSGSAGATDGNGATARFRQPLGIAADSAGNIFVADGGMAYTIRKITPAADVTTFAGTNMSSGTTDGTGSAARFSGPNALKIDSSDNLYVSDAQSGTYYIRKITSGAVVTTTAYSQSGIIGDIALVPSADPFFISDNSYSVVKKWSASNFINSAVAGTTNTTGTTDGSGSAALFNHPTGVATTPDGSTTYICDYTNHTIRKLVISGANVQVSTLAGTAGTAGYTDGTGTAATFNNPNGIAMDKWGNLYVVCAGSNDIRKVTPEGRVKLIAGMHSSGYADGLGTASKFKAPQFIAVDSSGNLYVSDTNNYIIRKISLVVP